MMVRDCAVSHWEENFVVCIDILDCMADSAVCGCGLTWILVIVPTYVFRAGGRGNCGEIDVWWTTYVALPRFTHNSELISICI